MELNAQAEEISRLQRCISNLVSLLALPETWSGSEPVRILESLFDALLPLLSLDFVCGRLQDAVSNTPVTVTRVAPSCDLESDEIRQVLSDWFEGDGQKCLSVTRKQFADKGIAVLPVPLELRGGTGMILAGSRREDFPVQNESLALSVAANQTSIWLNEAWILTQRKRATDQLETQIAERAKELFEANEKLKRNEEALQAREGDLRSIIDAIPTLAWSAGPDGSADFLNRRWLDYTGLSEKQAQGWGWRTAIHPADVEGLVKHWQSALASGVPVEAEARMRRFDGAYRWFLFLANPLRDELGKVVKWYGTNVDIEDRKCVEEGLRASELSWRQTVDNIPGFVLVTDPMGKVEFLNRQILEYFGKTSEDLKIWNVIDAVHPDDIPRSIEARKKSIEGGQAYELELRCRRADGVYRWFQVRGVPARDEENKITARYLLLTDIEDRKRTEEALQSNERNLNLILNTIPTHIYVLNGEGYVKRVNQAVMDYTGLTLEDVQQEDYRDRVIHPEDFKRVRGERTASLRRGSPFSTEQRVLGNDGQYRWFLVRYKPLLDEQGHIVRWYVAAFDIEDRKRAEQALQQSQVYLHEAQRLAQMGSWAFNAAGFRYWSSELFHIHGLDPKDRPPTVGEYLDLVHAEDREFMQQAIQKMLADHLGFDFTKRIVRPDGKIRHMRWVGVPAADGATLQDFVGTGMDVTEQEELVRKLRQSEADLRTITDAIRQSIVVLAPDGRTLYANRVALDRTGLTLGEANDEGFFTRVFHPDDREGLLAERQHGLSQGTPFELESRVRQRNGEYRWHLLQYNPLKDEQGQIIRWYSTATDIDDRKKAEVALEAMQRNLSLMINAIPTFIQVSQPDGTVLSVNQTVLDYHGVKLQDVLKEDFRSRVYHPDDAERLREMRKEALKRPLPFEYEQRALGKDGRYRWFLVRYNPLLDEQGRIERWYVAAFDIEDRKQAEAKVEQAYLRLAEAQRLSKTGSFISDLLADEHDWSDETFRIFEFDPATKVTVRMIRDIVHPEDLPSFDATIARGMTGTDVDFVFRIMLRGGAVKYIRGLARVMTQVGSHPLFIGALQDVTEGKVAEEALDRARSELAHVARVTTLNALTASIAHEINQPLASLITNASICLRRLSADPPNLDGARETLLRTIRDGNRASDVIIRLRALFTKKELTSESLDLNDATREVIALALNDLQRNRVVLQPELADDLPPVIGDRVQLQQVTLNLLRNASDAMADVQDRPRQLLIRTQRQADNHVCLSVRDAGCGVNPQDFEKLFEPFYTTKTGGMGIGLSVSRSIIERHHGRLWAEPNDGPGTTFSFSIPCGQETATGAA